METPGNIFLVGLMGAGKTTVGRALAKKLNLRFIDSDHEIERRTGVTIPVIFDIEGEASFRQREADVIRELTAQRGIVLATGGGVVLNEQSRHYLKTRGTVIYLRASVSHILHRTGHDKNRPLLQTDNPRKVLEDLARLRDPLYQEVAHVLADTGRSSLSQLVQSILSKIEYTMHPMSTTESIQPAASSEHILQVELGDRSYPIVIAPNALDQAGDFIRSDRYLIITNNTVAPLYLNRVSAGLQRAGKQGGTLVLPDGEQFKTMETLNHIFDRLVKDKADRKTTLIALGGGVIGDITGFAAASYMRGVPFVQIPTTLLSQVDSSVGGKTGVNHPLGKNMIGAFYQPQAVISDTTTLATLPGRELSAGLAEVIKYGAIIDMQFFGWLEQNCRLLRNQDHAALAYAIECSCAIKADIVRQDEREGGLRAILNFGHTFAHAIESAMGYGVWLHGEAVGCGMVMAAELSHQLGYITQTDVNRLRALVTACGLPTLAPNLGFHVWKDWMSGDKKNEFGKIRFILLKPMGRAVIESVSDHHLEATLQICCTV